MLANVLDALEVVFKPPTEMCTLALPVWVEEVVAVFGTWAWISMCTWLEAPPTWSDDDVAISICAPGGIS
jgi:hypothetical protein